VKLFWDQCEITDIHTALFFADQDDVRVVDIVILQEHSVKSKLLWLWSGRDKLSGLGQNRGKRERKEKRKSFPVLTRLLG